jgi:hypothetical protein
MNRANLAWKSKRVADACNSLSIRLAGGCMSTKELEVGEAQWRAAVIELARAQRVYAEIAASPDAPELLVNRAWLGLWRAERRHDELLGSW